MKTVLFLGAGATRAQYEAEDKAELQRRLSVLSNPEWKIVPPFLDLDFVDLALERCVYDTPVIEEYLVKRYGLNLLKACKRKQMRIGMEWMFSLLWRDARQATEGDTEEIEAFKRLLFAYLKLITVSTQPMTHPNVTRDTPLVGLLQYFIRSCEPISAITTNHDLLVENILEPSTSTLVPDQYTKTYGTHTLPKLYALPSKTVGITLEEETRPRFSVDGWPNIPMLKLHGSLNVWCKARDALLRADPEASLYLLWERLPLERVESVKDPDGSRLDPFVVPPIQEKDLPLVMRRVWQAARKQMGHCERLIVFGYSFPEADCDARRLFDNVSKRTLKEAIVIDLAVQPAATLQAILDQKGIRVNVEHRTSVRGYTGGA